MESGDMVVKEKRKAKGEVEEDICSVRMMNWLEEGKKKKWIFVRCKDTKSRFGNGSLLTSWLLLIIPAKCLYLSNQFQQSNKKQIKDKKHENKHKKMKKDLMFNHSLTHTSPLHFSLPYDCVIHQFAELSDASWVVLGSTVYFFGVAGKTGCSDNIYYLKCNVDGFTFPNSLNIKQAGCMVREKRVPKVVALDGKIYVFGKTKYVSAEVFEPYPHDFEGQSRMISLPIPQSSACDILFVFAMEQVKKIVAGFSFKVVDEQVVEPTTRTTIFEYDVVLGSWVEHDNNFLLNSSRLLCQPVAVDGCVYWLDSKLWAYDLSTRQYYEGTIEDCFFQHILKTPEIENLKVSLFHLVGDFFGMTWVDNRNSTVLHATTIHILRTTTKLQTNLIKLCATVFSCQSFASNKSLLVQDRTLIV